MINYKKIFPRATCSSSSQTGLLVDQQGVDKVVFIRDGYVNITVAEAGKFVDIEEEGATQIIRIPADSVKTYRFNFGELGFPLTANTVLNLTTDGEATVEAICCLTCHVL